MLIIFKSENCSYTGDPPQQQYHCFTFLLLIYNYPLLLLSSMEQHCSTTIIGIWLNIPRRIIWDVAGFASLRRNWCRNFLGESASLTAWKWHSWQFSVFPIGDCLFSMSRSPTATAKNWKLTIHSVLNSLKLFLLNWSHVVMQWPLSAFLKHRENIEKHVKSIEIVDISRQQHFFDVLYPKITLVLLNKVNFLTYRHMNFEKCHISSTLKNPISPAISL